MLTPITILAFKAISNIGAGSKIKPHVFKVTNKLAAPYDPEDPSKQPGEDGFTANEREMREILKSGRPREEIVSLILSNIERDREIFTYDENKHSKRSASFVSIEQHWNSRPGEQTSIPDGILALDCDQFNDLRRKLDAMPHLVLLRQAFEYWSEWRDMGGPHLLKWDGPRFEHLGFIPKKLVDEIEYKANKPWWKFWTS